MRNEQYWKEYYKTHDRQEPSSFARWALPRVTGSAIVDMGCGDGRDTGYLIIAQPGYLHEMPVAGVQPVVPVLGVDPAITKGPFTLNITIQEFTKQYKAMEEKQSATLYMRWFLHAVKPRLWRPLLEVWEGQILVEARLQGDTSYGDSHPRYPIDTDELFPLLDEWGYDVDHYEEGDFGEPTKPSLFRLDATR